MQVKAALPVSATAHAAIIGLLLLLPGVMPAPPKIDLSNAVEVVFAPSPTPPVNARPPVPPVAEQPPPPPLVEQPPLPPPAPQVAQADPHSTETGAEPRPPVPPIDRHRKTWPLPVAGSSAGGGAAGRVAAAGGSAGISADYARLSSWPEATRYLLCSAARMRGAALPVDRSGRVLDYARQQHRVQRSRRRDRVDDGATLPPFPASMTSPEIEVW